MRTRLNFSLESADDSSAQTLEDPKTVAAPVAPAAAAPAAAAADVAATAEQPAPAADAPAAGDAAAAAPAAVAGAAAAAATEIAAVQQELDDVDSGLNADTAAEAAAGTEGAAPAEGDAAAAPAEGADAVIVTDETGSVSGDAEGLETDVEVNDAIETSEMEEDSEIASADAEASVAEGEETAAVLESLHVMSSGLKSLIKTGQCTDATLQLVHESVDGSLRRLGLQMPALSLESEQSIEEQHRQLDLALEGVLGRLGQEWVMGNKHSWNAIADFFRSAESKAEKYSTKLDAAQKEFDAKKGSLPAEQHKASLTGLWYHYANDKGQVTDIIPATEADLKISRYLLVDYPKQILPLLKHQMSVLAQGKNLKDPKELEKLIKDLVGAGKHPVELFDSKLVSEGFPLLSVVGLREKSGSARKVLGASEDYKKLSVMSQTRYIYEQGSLKHTAKKVGSHAGSALPFGVGIAAWVGNHATTKSFNYATEDIGKLIALGKEYISNIEQFRLMDREVDHMYNTLWDLYWGDNADKDPENWNFPPRLIEELFETIWSTFMCFWYPAAHEAKRALKCAKYSHYTALRMIHHGIKGD